MEQKNQNTINEEVLQKLLEFEQLEVHNASPNWEADLERKLQLTASTANNHSDSYSFLVLALFFLNVGLFVFSLYAKKEPTTSRTADLQVISNELLVPTNE